MGPTPGSFKPGVSGNPAGRPRRGSAFAERVRERVDPDLVIDLAMKVAEDERLSPQERLRELWPLIDRGFIKPPTNAHVSVESSSASGGVDLDSLSAEELERRLALLTETTVPSTVVTGDDSTTSTGRCQSVATDTTPEPEAA